MRTLPKCGLAAALTLMPLTLLSTGVSAQQTPTKDTPACEAHVLPTSIPAGISASRLTVTLSQTIGDVSTFTPSKDSGIQLADAKDLPKTDMTQSGATPEPIQMSNDAESRVTVWVNTAKAKAGDYSFTLQGASGTCKGTLKVVEHS